MEIKNNHNTIEKSKVAIVIPPHKSDLSNNESISLRQCRKVLGDYDLYFLKPQSVTFNFEVHERIIDIDDVHLSSRKKYSDYVLSLEFYDLFSEYQYILIYQLDAFVFKDELLSFCDMGYDYIGAPWINGLECHVLGEKWWYLGNGGLSLRKVSAFKEWLTKRKKEVDEAKMVMPEDIAIASYGREFLSIAPVHVALTFSFDLNPEECFENNKNRLPFGCHAWHRFNPVFWKNIIDEYGYCVEINNYEDEETILLSSGKNRAQLLETYYDSGKIDECLRGIISNYCGCIYIFGVGHYGVSFFNMAKAAGITVVAFIDNDKEKIGKSYEGIPIVALKNMMADGVCLVAMARHEGVVYQLETHGLKHGVEFATSKELQYAMIKGINNN